MGDTADRAAAAAALAVVAAVAWGAVAAQRPPRPSGEPAAAEFSARRAAGHVAALAAAPRPVGTEQHRRARDYLVAELEALGLEVGVQTTHGLREARDGVVMAARLHNVVGRWRGSDSTGALLLMAHYDTRPNTPGAGDDAAGVAVVLEALRALGEGEPPRNDVIALFADGEELGLLGARAFAERHPASSEVAVVLNFEARGNHGAATMFEAGAADLELVRELARAAPRPLASSLSSAVYRRMPNDTDFTVFEQRGLPGLNVAFIGGHPSYHSMLDTPERLSTASLAHLGGYALSLARGLGSRDLSTLGGGDGVYFNPVGWWLAVHPTSWVTPLAVVAAVLAGAALLVAARVGAIGTATFRGLLISLLVPVGAAAVGYLFWHLFARFLPHRLATPHGLPYETQRLALALCCLVVAWAAVLARWQRDRVRPLELAAGSLLAWTLLAAVASVVLPAGSYLFVWPAVVLAPAVALAAVWGSQEGRGPRAVACLAAAALPAVVLLAPIVSLVTVALTLRSGAAVAAFMALPLLSTLALLRLAQPGRTAWIAAALAAAAVVLVAWVALEPPYTAARPRAESLFYALDTDTGEASWWSLDAGAGAWSASLLGEAAEAAAAEAALPGSWDADLRRAPVAAVELQPPGLEVLSDVREGPQGSRTIEVRFFSARGAPNLRLEAESSVAIRLLAVDGEAVGRAGPGEYADRVRLDYFGVPAQGFRATFEVPGRWPVEVRLADQSYGWPQLEPPVPARPAAAIPTTGWLTDSVCAVRTLYF